MKIDIQTFAHKLDLLRRRLLPLAKERADRRFGERSSLEYNYLYDGEIPSYAEFGYDPDGNQFYFYWEVAAISIGECSTFTINFPIDEIQLDILN